MEAYYNREIECLPRKQLAELQRNAFSKLYDYVMHRNPSYRKLLESSGIAIGKPLRTEEIPLLPIIDKKDLAAAYPLGMQAAPASEIIRIHGTSGTSGKMILVPCTAADISAYNEGLCRALIMQGCNEQSVIQNTFSYSMFIGGIGIQSAAERIGAAVIPTSVGNTERQISLMRDLGTTCLAATPSYAMHIFKKMRSEGISPTDSALRTCFIAGELCTDEKLNNIESLGGVKAYNVYGNAEMTNVFASCSYNTGMHIPEDMIFAEIIGDKGEQLQAGSVGELVITTLTKTGMPLIRYNTHDLAIMYDDECPCGRTGKRVRILGRSDDMIIHKGCKFFPSDIDRLVSTFDFLSGVYRISLPTADNMTLTVTAEAKDGFSIPHTAAKERFREASRKMLGVALDLELVCRGVLDTADGNKMKLIKRTAKAL